jgi:hypothetical protein
MGKRISFLYLFLLLVIPFSGICQTLSVDSVEVTLIIPDNYQKSIINKQDTVIEEVQSEILNRFLRIDSVFPEKRVYASDRAGIEVDCYYNQLAKPYLYHHSLLDLLVFDDLSHDSFNPYSLSFRWLNSRGSMAFTLSLKYKNRDYGDLDSKNSVQYQLPLKRYQVFLNSPSHLDTIFPENKISPIYEAMEKLVINDPSRVQDYWNSIPEPLRFSMGSQKFENRISNEEISRILNFGDPESKKHLDKIDAIKRPWSYGGTENIQFSQAFLENWIRGGENSISLLSDLRLQAKFHKKDVEWESYGIHKLGILDAGENEPRINDDYFELNTKYGLRAGEKWFYSGLFNFKTQFFMGYENQDVEKENPISGFLAPAYLTLAVGMDYKEKNFTLMLLPVTSKMTAVLDTAKFDQTRFKIAEDKKWDKMGGASLVNNFKWAISEDFNMASKIDFFYEYLRDDNHIQTEWELILDMNINVFFSTRITTYLRYYTNESDKLQFRENLSISFNYRF